MTMTGNPTEPSMEDILASIRKIIADEPADARKPPPAPQGFGQPAPFSMKDIARKPAEVPAEGAGPGLAAPGIQLPTARDALAGHVPSRATEPTPSAPLPEPNRARAAAIDEDLADLIEAVPSDADGALGRSRSEVSPVDAARQKWANLINPASTPSVPGPAQGSASTPGLAPGPAPITEAPSGTMAASSRPAPEASPPATASVPSPTPPSPSSLGPAPASGLFMPRKTGFYPPSGYNSAPAPAPEVPSSAPPSVPAAASEQPPVSIEAPVVAGSPPPPADLEVAPPKDDVAPPVEPAMAAEAALDALAAGLAKSSSETAGDRFSNDAAVTAKPVAVPPPAAGEVSSAGPRPLETRSPDQHQSRTLEDVVVDMMRPMLEKWLAENMPRIVERALKLDAAAPGKPGTPRSSGG